MGLSRDWQTTQPRVVGDSAIARAKSNNDRSILSLKISVSLSTSRALSLSISLYPSIPLSLSVFPS